MIEIRQIDTDKAAEEQAERLEAYKGLIDSMKEEPVSIPSLLENIAERFCDGYCKYPEKWDPEKEGCELCESGICATCPVNRLI